MNDVEVYTGPGVMAQAEAMARSNLVPKAFRGKPADVLVAMMLGQELGLGPMATMSMVDVIEGNATLNAEGKVSLVRKAGHSINGEALATKATAHGKRRDTGDEMTVEWTMQMAQRAGLAGKAVWKQYPEAMLWSRAVSQLCRMLFPDVLAGLSYTPEEVEAFTGVETVAIERTPPVEVLPPATVRRAPPSLPMIEPAPKAQLSAARAALSSGENRTDSLTADGPPPTTSRGGGIPGGDPVGSRSAAGSIPATSATSPRPPPNVDAETGEVAPKTTNGQPFTDDEILSKTGSNPRARAIHIHASKMKVDAELLATIIEGITGDPSANSVGRDDRRAVIDAITAAAPF